MRAHLPLVAAIVLSCSSSGDGEAGPGGGGGSSGAPAGGSGGSSAGGSGGTSETLSGRSRYFPEGAWFTRDIRAAPVRADSAAITAWMVEHAGPGGWGTGAMRIDFSFVVVDAAPGTARRSFRTVDAFHADPDCDIAPVPLPDGGAVEQYPAPTSLLGLAGYECPGFDGGEDCHVLVFAPSERRLYELYHATVRADGTFEAGCLALWPTDRPLLEGRGEQCTSADAAGFPIAPLLFRPGEIQAGKIEHAIRFILPNDMIRQRQYVHPATHGTSTTGPDTSAPYGSLFRLRADYPVDQLGAGAQVIARAMQVHGMYLSDGGNIALTAESDVLSPVKWEDVGIDSRSLAALKATDFEVIDTGEEIDVTYRCERTRIVE